MADLVLIIAVAAGGLAWYVSQNPLAGIIAGAMAYALGKTKFGELLIRILCGMILIGLVYWIAAAVSG